jgi:tight adherence protein C
MILIIAILIFAAVGLVSSYAFSPRENALRRRALSGMDESQIQVVPDLHDGPLKRLIIPSVRSAGELLARLLPQNLVANVQRTLAQANDPMSLSGFLFFWGAMAVSPLIILVLVVRLSPDVGFLRLVVLGGVLLFFGLFVPYFLLRRRARARIRKIQRALPDAFDLLLTSVEAGLGVDSAFAIVAERFPGPVGETFSEYLRQVGLGRSRRDALEDIAQRSGVNELIKLSASVAQATEVGTTIGDVLRLQAAELRAERRLRAQEAAQRAPVLMVIPLALCFMPAMAAVVIVPSILHLLRFVGELGK